MASYFNKRWFIYVDCKIYRPACQDNNVNNCPEFDECPHVPIEVCPKYTCQQYYHKYSRVAEMRAFATYYDVRNKLDFIRDLKKVYNY